MSSTKRKTLLPALGGGDGLADTGTTLPRVEVLVAGDGVRLLDGLLGLGQDELNVAGRRHVGVDLEEESLS